MKKLYKVSGYFWDEKSLSYIEFLKEVKSTSFSKVCEIVEKEIHKSYENVKAIHFQYRQILKS